MIQRTTNHNNVWVLDHAACGRVNLVNEPLCAPPQTALVAGLPTETFGFSVWLFLFNEIKEP